MRKSWLGIFVLLVSTAHGQSLRELLKQAEQNYPLLKAKQFEIVAAKDYVTSVKNTALPSLDAAYQANYATYNNITGMASPQFFVPISGPPSSDNTSNGVFGSAASLLMNWDLFTFGQRTARTDLAKSNVSYSQADAANEVFRHQVNVVQSYLDLLLAHELLRVYEKNLDRSKENNKVVQALAKSGLRPGVDTALFSAEMSRAKIELLNHRKFLESQQVAFTELLATENISFVPDSNFFYSLPSIAADSASTGHPLLSLSTSKLEINRLQRTAVARTLYPKLTLWGTAYARGSGINYNGEVNSTDGLTFSRYNYGVGLQLSVPLLRFIDVKTQLDAQNNLIRSQEQRVELVKLQLNKQDKMAALTLANAMSVARESPVFYNAAKYSYEALTSRYNAGLTNYADLMQAQYVFLKAEVDLKKSYVETWKALLYTAAVRGDLSIFLNQVDNK